MCENNLIISVNISVNLNTKICANMSALICANSVTNASINADIATV